MSFGWSAGDIVSFARVCYEIYSFCAKAPAELQDLLDRLDGLGRKLNRLSYILRESGLEHWPAATALEKDLHDVKSYLEPLRTATNNATSVSSKAKGLGKYALNQDKIRSMERNLLQREREIDDMKIDIILACSLRNLRYGHNQVQRGYSSSPTPENVIQGTGPNKILPPVAMLPAVALDPGPTNVPSRSISNASMVLAAAVRLRSRQSTALETRSNCESVSNGSVSSSQLAQDFVAEIASIAEQQELYSGNVDHSKNVKLLTGIADTATHFDFTRPPSERASSYSSAFHQLPRVRNPDSTTFEQATFDQLFSASDSASLRLWASDQYQKAASEPSQESAVDSASLPPNPCELIRSAPTPVQNNLQVEDEILPVRSASSPAQIASEIGNTSQSERLNLQGWSKVSTNINSRAAMSCSYEVEVSPGSLVVVCIPIHQPRNNRETTVASGAHPTVSSHSTTRLPSVVRHCIQPNSRIVPHLLHPDVEGPAGEPNAPYTLSFTEPQWISVEGSSKGLHQTTSLKYISEKQADRSKLCERIFGKTFIMSVGSNRIYLDDYEISHLSAISLWFDASHESLSVTFLNNLRNKKAAPKDEEWRVYGLWSKGKPLRNQTSLALAVGPVFKSGEIVDSSNALTRLPSNGSRGSVLKKKLFTSSTKNICRLDGNIRSNCGMFPFKHDATRKEDKFQTRQL